MRRLKTVAALVAVLLGASSKQVHAAGPADVGHVFIIVLENKGFEQTFGTGSPATYLNAILRPQGQLLRQYYGIGHLSLDNYVAMVSGQAPNLITQTDCILYLDFVGLPALGPDGQAIGQGCVYPAFVQTVVDQLEGNGLTWKGYMEDMGNTPSREPMTCGNPALNSLDGTQSATAEDQYGARHNPFVYFHSILDPPGRCGAHVVPLTALDEDLASAATTPNYVFITPDLCHDAHDASCAGGGPGGLVAADEFLNEWVPKILDSDAYKTDGLLIITFDEADVSPNEPDGAAACCNEPSGFNTVLPGLYGPGGGRTGSLLLSPLVEANSTNDTPYNHYSLLRSIEDIFCLPPLGYAAKSNGFGADVYAP
jgi:hypothetical protein